MHATHKPRNPWGAAMTRRRRLYYPHPFRGAGRDGIATEFLRVLKQDGARTRRRPLSKNITKLKKKQTWKKNDLKESLKVDPKIIKMVSRHAFLSIDKTLNSASVFFLPFAVSGTPGPSPIVQIP